MLCSVSSKNSSIALSHISLMLSTWIFPDLLFSKCMVELCFPNPLNQRRRWHPTPVLLPGISHGQGSLVGCGPWGCEESGTTEWLPFHFSLSCIGEGNGNPLQCSCLENPRDRGALWAAVYGVTQSRTQLKWLSSSSSNRILQKEKLYLCKKYRK